MHAYSSPADKPVILVTDLEYRKARTVFERAEDLDVQTAPSDEPSLARRVEERGAAGVIVGTDAYKDRLYEVLPRGAVVARFGVGCDGIDRETATARGLFCTNTPGALDRSVAEHTLGLILACARHLGASGHSLRGGTWAPRVGVEVRGRRLAVIGTGAIGRQVARMARDGFGMEVSGCGREPPEESDSLFTPWTREFRDAVAGADFVSLHIPATDATRHFLNRDRLARLGPDTWLINTSRGSVVDEEALYDALASGHLRGAALDVFETEPYAPRHPDKDLRSLDQVTMTPHVASSTQEACQRMASRALENIRAALGGKYAEMDLVNPDVLTARRTEPVAETV